MEQLASNPKQNQTSIVPIELLRDKIRQYSISQRELQRANLEDSIRLGLGEIKSFIEQLDDLTEKDIVGIANRIKRRKHATPEDMYRLSHAFLQGLHNIVAFNKIPGALQILIKELTGKDADCQIRAAECLCNLSLGEAPVCDKIATMAGSYLVTYIHSTETELVRLCLWTITNILATNTNDGKSCKGFHMLVKMELLPQLWKLYVDENCMYKSSTDYREDVALCIQVIVLNPIAHTQKEYGTFFLQHAEEKKPPSLSSTCPTSNKEISSDGSEYHLQIIFHTLFQNANDVRNFSQSLCLYLINYALTNILQSASSSSASSTISLSLNQSNTKENIKILYAIRILSNLLASHQTSDIFTFLQQQLSLVWHTDLLWLLNKLFSYNSDALTFETLWFLKNILSKMAAQNTYANSSENNFNQNDFLDKLCINFAK